MMWQQDRTKSLGLSNKMAPHRRRPYPS